MEYKKNINPKNVKILEVIGDGNYMVRSITKFIYGNEFIQKEIRYKFYEEAYK